MGKETLGPTVKEVVHIAKDIGVLAIGALLVILGFKTMFPKKKGKGEQA